MYYKVILTARNIGFLFKYSQWSQLQVTLQSFITKALEYKAILKFKKYLYALLHISYSDESLFT